MEMKPLQIADQRMPFKPPANPNAPSIQICLLGGLFDISDVQSIEGNSVKGVQTAANTLQWALVNGFEENLPGSVTIVTAPFVGAFPNRYRKPRINSKSFAHRSGAEDKVVGFLNLPLIKHFSRARQLRPAMRAWIKSTPGPKAVIAYSLNYPFVRTLSFIKSFAPDVTTCVVVPDLPEHMNTSSRASRIYDSLKRLEIHAIRSHFACIDALVLLTDSMRDRLPHGPDYVVVEGIASPQSSREDGHRRPDEERTILYAGTMNARYGILDLLDAFAGMKDSSIRLVLCGDGDSDDRVRAAALADPRIQFLGRVDHNKALELQRNATLLVNPRRNDEIFAKYSFPSKILEYMASGRPVVAYELDGMPEEYRDYLIYAPPGDPSGLADTLTRLIQMEDSDLDAIGARSKHFVSEQKNPLVQTRKIITLLECVSTKTANSRSLHEETTT